MAAKDVILIRTTIANNYLVPGEKPYMVDTNTPKTRAEVLKAINANGMKPEDIEYIFVTHHHYDHAGNLAELKRLSGAVVGAGGKDAPVIEGKQEPPGPAGISLAGRLLGKLPSSWVEGYQHYDKCAVDLELSDGDRIEELGLEVLELPGHTRGAIALYHPDGNWAFVGDMVANILGRTGPPFLSFSYDRSEIIRSIERLAELDLDYAFPGHGAVLGPKAGERIAELVSRLKRKW